MKRVLPLSFYNRKTLTVARDLLGKILVRRVDGKLIRSSIVEVEAYDGPHDLACHASKGKTDRTAVMFGPAGHWYVYLIYGMYEMLNIVTGPKEYPAAVLFRGVEEAIGPGRLTKHLHINRKLNALPATRKTGLWIEDDGTRVPPREIETSPRINVNYAGPVWSKKPYRFVWKKKRT